MNLNLEKEILEIKDIFLNKKRIKFGINECYKFLKNNNSKKCFVLIANDVFPKEIVSHIEDICKEKEISYSKDFNKKFIGRIYDLKQSACCVFILFEKEELEQLKEGDNLILKDLININFFLK